MSNHLDIDRTRRISIQIKQELAQIMRRDLYDVRLNTITVTNVKVSKDLKLAKIYVLNGIHNLSSKEIEKKCAKVSSFLRYKLSQRLRLRVTPRLEFFFDDTLEQACAISALIDSVLPIAKDDQK